DYRVRAPVAGLWREVLNTDAALYGGSNQGNAGAVRTTEGDQPELNLVIPPLAAIFLVPQR
ncbi:MAG: alpha amylase C-terminal domain-containing protein, partial [Variibacter sp.]|nr:alpha amylase C-terminal domain-containing protein [Variibacter sp.]